MGHESWQKSLLLQFVLGLRLSLPTKDANETFQTIGHFFKTFQNLQQVFDKSKLVQIPQREDEASPGQLK
jgi:hypothetical protein